MGRDGFYRAGPFAPKMHPNLIRHAHLPVAYMSAALASLCSLSPCEMNVLHSPIEYTLVESRSAPAG